MWIDNQKFVTNTLKHACKKYKIVVINVRYIKCNYTGKPAWAQNDAMMEAYMDGMNYGYRINDDTLLKTRGWTEKFIGALQSFNPPNVGVVGPTHSGGSFRHGVLILFISLGHTMLFVLLKIQMLLILN